MDSLACENFLKMKNKTRLDSLKKLENFRDSQAFGKFSSFQVFGKFPNNPGIWGIPEIYCILNPPPPKKKKKFCKEKCHFQPKNVVYSNSPLFP